MVKDIRLKSKKETIKSLKEMFNYLVVKGDRTWWENYKLDILYSAIKYLEKKKKQ